MIVRVIMVMIMVMTGSAAAACFLPKCDAADNDEAAERDAAEEDCEDELVGQDVVIAEQADLPGEKADAGKQAANRDGADLVEKIALAVAMVVGVGHGSVSSNHPPEAARIGLSGVGQWKTGSQR